MRSQPFHESVLAGNKKAGRLTSRSEYVRLSRSLSDYVQIYDGTLSEARCRELIDRFEAEPQLQQPTPSDKSFRFVELNISWHWPEVHGEIGALMMAAFRRYS